MNLRHILRSAVCAILTVSAVAAGAADKPPAARSGSESIVLGMGCFWGAEKRMAAVPGVLDVESGYANGDIQGGYNAILAQEKAIRAGQSNKRNHAEVVKVTFDPAKTTLEKVLIQFWENHDPTQGDRQGNDVGSNYRSAIYTAGEAQQALALKTRDAYQKALSAAGRGRITTEIAPLKAYFRAEDYHQDYLVKNPDGYCGLGGTGVKYPGSDATPMAKAPARVRPLDGARLNQQRQLVVFEAEDCAYCRQFKAEVLDRWKSPVPVVRTLAPEAPTGWTLEKPLFATPTIVLFEKGKEVSRYTGYNGDQARFWKWLGFHLLTPAQQKIAFEQGTERPGTGSHLDEKRPGTFVDPITGAALFRSDTKFDSGTGWPSFFNPLPGSITLHEDVSHGMRRVEVRSASSGIHLGHVFDDGPPPSGKRYCINGNVLQFVPDQGK
ncbi:MAG: peptide-methionine (S)-S-oxide reductase MsrA [Azonexaceae bacterium]|uniref:peptide-methionine (S)-S-oxide reductase MsrA n=1 Tax=Azonexus sp. R2A61 TaxID=2744443 RepID=UPI001F2FE3D5|nr:peptide-methionine (S)-S-oxide reductase MsrA [Azonexus sp. R2A61]MCE1239689.1 peptide-methionine (S)-S-oxide reductase MsrA [Azonexaceae bacterium]